MVVDGPVAASAAGRAVVAVPTGGARGEGTGPKDDVDDGTAAAAAAVDGAAVVAATAVVDLVGSTLLAAAAVLVAVLVWFKADDAVAVADVSPL